MFAFVDLARAVEQLVLDFNPQELANTSWSFAKTGHADWANYNWPIITRFKGFNRRHFDEFLDPQDDHKHRLKRP